MPYLYERIMDPHVDVAESAIVAAEAAELHRLLRRLPALERQVLCRHYGVGCQPQSLSEIAVRLAVPKSAAWRLEQRALDKLRSAYRHGSEVGVQVAPPV